MNILLVAPPWPLFNRPSIQIAALKAYLLKNEPDINVRCLHPYLHLAAEIGFDLYHEISQSGWAAESVCAGALFPEKAPQCDKVFYRGLATKGLRQKTPNPEHIRRRSVKIFDAFIEKIPLEKTDLVGFTACLNQLTASLLMAKKIKQLRPNVPIVIGGASCAGPIGPSLLSAFPFVDFVIDGEGERPFLTLTRFIMGKEKLESSKALYSAQSAAETHLKVTNDPASWPKWQVEDLNQLPAPDFRDYFHELSMLPASKRFFPVLPVEFSRGCWWGRCNFCNLNLQWKGYREKSVDRMVNEVLFLSKTYKVLDFAFMDNVLPRKSAPEFFKRMGERGIDLNFFAELRAVYPKESLMIMKKGGLRDIQIGIEALSASLLKRIGKGVSLMDNIAAMRHAEETGLRLSANLIVHFPGSTRDEVEETLDIIDLIWPYRPLQTVSFWLGMASPVHKMASSYGLRGIKPHPFMADLFPEKILRGLLSLILTYKADRKIQKRIWKPVEKKVLLWQKWHRDYKRKEHPLYYRDGGDYLIIKRVSPDKRLFTHRLSGLSRKLYLMCTNPKPLEQVMEQAPTKPRERVMAFLQDLTQKGLLFMRDGKILSLAVHRP